jgi:anthranilate phosphoribosyltransferase
LQITGTGGDTLKTINVSTLSAMVMASMGIKVVKTGGKAHTGLMGASDFFLKLVNDFDLDSCLINNPDKALKRFNFYFADVVKYYPWIEKIDKMKDIFGEELFLNIFKNMHRNEMNSEVKIVGMASRNVEKNLNHFMKYGYTKLLIVHGLTKDDRIYIDEASNLGPTWLAYLINGNTQKVFLSPLDFRNAKKVNIENIRQKDKNELYRFNIAIIKGEGTEELIDLVSINAAIYINFINNFKLDFKKIYKQIQCQIQQGRVFKHFLK